MARLLWCSEAFTKDSCAWRNIDIGKLCALTQSQLNLKKWNLQGRRTCVQYCILVTVYLLHLLHLPMTLAVGEVEHVSQIDPLDYEKFCQNFFSLNCPNYEDDSWDCAKRLTNCTSPDYPYHCIKNADGKVYHVCAAPQICQKGTVPIYVPLTRRVICQKCPSGCYQDEDILSYYAPYCKEKFKCDIAAHKIECPAESGNENTQDTLCRCDARNGYIYIRSEGISKCFKRKDVRCFKYDCPDGQERLIHNYTCAPKCREGFERNDSDICVPKSAIIPLTTRVTEKASPTSAASSENSSEETSSGVIDTLIALIVVMAVLYVVILIIVAWKLKLYRICPNAVNMLRRQSSRDQTRVNDVLMGPLIQDPPGDLQQGTPSHDPPGDLQQGTSSHDPPGDLQQGTLSHDPLGDLQQGTPSHDPPGDLEQGTLSHDPPGDLEQGTSSHDPPGDLEQGTSSHDPPGDLEQGTPSHVPPIDPAQGTPSHDPPIDLVQETPSRVPPSDSAQVTTSHEKLHRRVLNRCLPKLIIELDINHVMIFIQQKELLDDVSIRDINEQRTTSASISLLIEKIQQKSRDTYEEFKKCLVQAGQDHLKDELEEIEKLL